MKLFFAILFLMASIPTHAAEPGNPGLFNNEKPKTERARSSPLRTDITSNEIGMICQIVDHTGNVFDNIINYSIKKHFDLSKVYLQIDCPFSRGMNIFRAVLRRRRRDMWRHMRSALGYFYQPAERREILRNALNKKFMGTTFLGKIQVYKRDKSFGDANMEIDKLEYYIKRDFGAEI